MATTVRQLGLRLEVDPREVRGAAKALGAVLERCGASDRITDEDAERISRVLRPDLFLTAAAS